MNKQHKGRMLVVYGAGDQGQVTAEIAEAAGWRVRGFLDDAMQAETQVAGRTIGNMEWLEQGDPVIVAIGDNRARRRILDSLIESGAELVSIIHPAASISPSARIGEGVMIGPMAVVNAQTIVEPGTIINTAAVIEHHNHIARAAHIGPGARLCGRVRVGEEALIGAGAVILPGTTISHRAIVGAGAVVDRHVKENQTVKGVPAR